MRRSGRVGIRGVEEVGGVWEGSDDEIEDELEEEERDQGGGYGGGKD